MAYAPSICCGDPEWRERSARQREPEPVFPAPLSGLACRWPVAERGDGVVALLSARPAARLLARWDVAAQGQSLSRSEEGEML